MERQVAELAKSLTDMLPDLPGSRRYLLSICGIPGSGKSSLAKRVVELVNEACRTTAQHPPAILVGMDGWHLTRKQLDEMEDPKLAHDRRGAPFTFDGEAFSEFVEKLREEPDTVAKAPSFSHATKDPVQDAITVEPHHRLVIIEGLYCNVNEQPWVRGARAFDERWLVTVDRDVAKERLKVRHVVTGVAKDEAEAIRRAENNDLPNGDWLLERLYEPAKRVPSLPEASWEGQM